MDPRVKPAGNGGGWTSADSKSTGNRYSAPNGCPNAEECSEQILAPLGQSDALSLLLRASRWLEGDAAVNSAVATLSPHQPRAPCQIGDVLAQVVRVGRNVVVFDQPGLNRCKFLRAGAYGLDRLHPTMGKIAERHHVSVEMEIVDRRIDFSKLLVGAKRSPARLIPLDREALPGDEPLVDDRQPGASGLGAAVKAAWIVWVSHGQSLSVISWHDRRCFISHVSTTRVC